MEFSANTTLSEYRAFLTEAAFVDIFQSPEWIAVDKAKGWGQEYIFSGRVNGEIVIAAIGHINDSQLGHYLALQHGPIFSEKLIAKTSDNLCVNWGEVNFTTDENKTYAHLFLKEIKNFAAGQNLFAVVIDPLATAVSDFGNLLKGLGYRQQRRGQLPKYPLFIDLGTPDTEILAGLEKNTRYYVKYARKQGVTVEFHYPQDESTARELIERFHPLLVASSKGKHHIPGKRFFITAAEKFLGKPNISIGFAIYNGEIISANFNQFFGAWAGTYYTSNTRNLPKLRASYLLKWETIVEAQRLGAKVFDMWGILPGIKSSHPEYGYSQFKLGFNPLKKEFSGRMVLPLQTWRYYVWKYWGELKHILLFGTR